VSYRVVLSVPVDPSAPPKTSKGYTENVLLEKLPLEYKVYILYYSGNFLNKELANKLKAFGQSSGKNLLVNIIKTQDDPHLNKALAWFGIKTYPSVIVTALSTLSSPPTEYSTAYKRIDNKRLLENTEVAFQLIQKTFILFIQGKISEAMRESNNDLRMFRAKALLSAAWEGVKSNLLDRDFSFETIFGRINIKRKGD